MTSQILRNRIERNSEAAMGQKKPLLRRLTPYFNLTSDGLSFTRKALLYVLTTYFWTIFTFISRFVTLEISSALFYGEKLGIMSFLHLSRFITKCHEVEHPLKFGILILQGKINISGLQLVHLLQYFGQNVQKWH